MRPYVWRKRRSAPLTTSLVFDVGVLFAVRDQMAFGWKAFGDVAGRGYVEHLLIPLEHPSVIQAATASETGVVHGPVTPSTVNSTSLLREPSNETLA